MANKPTKPIHQAKVFTPEQIQEQKKNQALAMLVQKREAFAVNILCHLCDGANQRVVVSMDSTKLTLDTNGLVDKAVEMADRLLERLYPVKEDKQ